MQLAAGVSLAHFRLVEKLGEGGMGEVWRAVDTTLDRQVAIKVLPPALAGDPERIARFEREAKALAALNHPNIAAIYGFPEATVGGGESVAGGERVRFLAMELVPGDDLAQVVAEGPLPLREVLDAAKQIAAALEAAHDSGIVHRDLKPANVRRTPDGRIKVLDFGLAKALEPAGTGGAGSGSGPGTGESRLATVTSAGRGPGSTVAGVILGTASYMSPEQARGLPVDRRTDLWAFGCVLFEMLTGTKAFDGATITDVLASIVRGEPDWERLPADTPVPMRRLLRRCLEKDPKKRLRDAGDASLLLEENPEDARHVAAAPAAPATPVALTPAKPHFAHWRIPVVIALVAAVVAGSGWWFAHRGGSATVDRPTRFQRLTNSRGLLRAARFAPDGRTIVYSAAWNGPPIRLYLGRTESSDATPIALPPAELLAVSKNGELAVALGLSYNGWMGEGTLARASLLGGSPREILENVRAADWTPDGSDLAVVHRVNGLDQLEYPIGKVLYKSSGYISDIRFAPDGKHIAFADHPVYGDDLGDIAMVDLEGRKTTIAAGFAAIHGVMWDPSGHAVWYCAARGEGAAFQFAIGVTDLAGRLRTVQASMTQIELFDLAPDGRMLVGSQPQERNAVALLAGTADPRAVVVPGESSMVHAVAEDGSAVLVTDQYGPEYLTYYVRAGQPGAVRIGVGEGYSISPDNRLALIGSADNRKLFVAPLGVGTTRPVPNPLAIAFESVPRWLTDGRRIVMIGRKGTEPARAHVLDTTTGAATPFGPPGVEWNSYAPVPIAPGDSEAILGDTKGGYLRCPLDGGAAVAVPGIRPGDVVLNYSADGTALFVAGTGVPIPIVRLELATGRRTPWSSIVPPDAAGLRIATVAMTRDGRHWALSTARVLTDVFLAEGIR